MDFHTLNKDAFVYTVEHEIGTKYHSLSTANFLVTATKAVFVGAAEKSAPVAVVGVQFRYNKLNEFFLNTTSKFNVPCVHMDVYCYLIDNNGFIVIHDEFKHVGKFIGHVDGDVLNELVNNGAYRRVRMFDYQAICLDSVVPSGPSVGPFFFSILSQGVGLVQRLLTTLAMVYVSVVYDGRSMAWAQTSDYARQGQPYTESSLSSGKLKSSRITTYSKLNKLSFQDYRH